MPARLCRAWGAALPSPPALGLLPRLEAAWEGGRVAVGFRDKGCVSDRADGESGTCMGPSGFSVSVGDGVDLSRL